jgi:4'-phosphopantetheinyl transferase
MFKTAARRRDWLLGRWTAKRLLQQIVEQEDGCTVSLDSLQICTRDNGAPATAVRTSRSAQGFCLSISHSAGYALCAAGRGQKTPIGADLEWIEPRSPRFLEGLLTESEVNLLRRSRSHHTQATALWCAKEAALKALGLGFGADPLAVSCLLTPSTMGPRDWTGFAIEWHRERLPRHGSPPPLSGRWQVAGGFVLALVAPPHLLQDP